MPSPSWSRPSGFTQVTEPVFPASAVITGVEAGSYTAAVLLDLEPFNPAVQGEEGIVVPVELEAPTEGPVQVEIVVPAQ